MISTLALLATVPVALGQISGINPHNPPHKAGGKKQSGTNQCPKTAHAGSECQNVWFKSLDDFCVWAPPHMGTVGAEEEHVVSYCLKGDHGTRLIPHDQITGATVIHTPDYIQIKGYLKDQTKLNIKKGNHGGELDPHGPTGKGNPIGGLVFANDPRNNNELEQVVEWISFIGDNQFCMRACFNKGPHPYQSCMHIYDEMGCDWVMPDHTPHGVFQTCHGEADRSPGLYVHNGHTSTWWEGTKPTPKPFKPAKTSNCVKQHKLTYASYHKHDAEEPAPAASSHKHHKVEAAHKHQATGAPKMARQVKADEHEL